MSPPSSASSRSRTAPAPPSSPSRPVSWADRISPREVPFSWARWGHVPLAILGLAWWQPAGWPTYLLFVVLLTLLWPFCLVMADGVEIYLAVGWTAAAGAYVLGPMILPVYWIASVAGFALIVLLDARGVLAATGIAAESACRYRGEAYDLATVADGDVRHTVALAEHALRVALAGAGRLAGWPLLPVVVATEALVAVAERAAPLSGRMAPRQTLARLAAALGPAMPLATTVLHIMIVCFLLLCAGAAGPAGFAAAALATLTLHFVLRRLSQTRLESERQRAALVAMQDALARRERMAAIGQTASSVFHQIARHHGAVGLYAHLLARAGTEPPIDAAALAATVREHAARISASVEEAKQVVDELLRFGQDRTLHLYPHSLLALVSECVEAVAPQAARAGVTVAITRRDDVVLPLDKRKLAQVIDNLLDNAIEATPAGGTVAVEVACEVGKARVSIHDEGPGVPEELQARLFTPFCTTKPDGIGLGLALARELAEAHGGTVRHVPTPRGARFVVELA